MWLVKIRPMLCEMVFYVEDFGDRCDTPISTFSSIVAHSVCDRKFDPIFSLRLDNTAISKRSLSYPRNPIPLQHLPFRPQNNPNADLIMTKQPQSRPAGLQLFLRKVSTPAIQ